MQPVFRSTRLLRNAKVSARVKELQDTQVERVISLEVKERNNRIALLQHKLEQLDMLTAARAADMKDLPGGATVVQGLQGEGRAAAGPRRS